MYVAFVYIKPWPNVWLLVVIYTLINYTHREAHLLNCEVNCSFAPLLSGAWHPEQAIQLCFRAAGEGTGPLEMVSKLWPHDKN